MAQTRLPNMEKVISGSESPSYTPGTIFSPKHHIFEQAIGFSMHTKVSIASIQVKVSMASCSSNFGSYPVFCLNKTERHLDSKISCTTNSTVIRLSTLTSDGGKGK